MPRPASSLGVLAAVVLLVLQGCVRVPEPRPPASVALSGKVGEGYVYLGPLVSLHPLWPIARRLEERAAELRLAATQSSSLPADWSWEEEPISVDGLTAPLAPGSLKLTPLHWPPPGEEAVEGEQQGYQEQELAWERARLEAQYARRYQEARASEEMGLATLEVRLWSDAQVAINNLKIRAAMPGPDAAVAREQLSKVMANLDRRRADATAASKARLAKVKAELDAALAQDVARAEARLRAQEGPRPTAPRVGTGADELAALSKILALRWWMPDVRPAKLSPYATAKEGELAKQARVAAEREQSSLKATRLAQAQRLQQSALDLERLISQDVENAVRALALSRGIVIHVLPLQKPAGSDMTQQCARWLRSTWPRH